MGTTVNLIVRIGIRGTKEIEMGPVEVPMKSLKMENLERMGKSVKSFLSLHHR